MTISRKGIGLVIVAAILSNLGILFKIAASINSVSVIIYLVVVYGILASHGLTIDELIFLINQFNHSITGPVQQMELAFIFLTVLAIIFLIVAIFLPLQGKIATNRRRDQKMEIYRPRGVTALAILFIIFADTGIISMIATIQLAQSNFNLNLVSMLLQIRILCFELTPEELAFEFLENALRVQIVHQAQMSTLNIVFMGVLILSILFVLTSIGLLYMMKWGYYLALAVGIILIILSIVLTNIYNIYMKWEHYLASLVGIVIIPSDYEVIPIIGFSLIILIAGILIIRYLRSEEIRYEFQ
jgi:hypothetical protein